MTKPQINLPILISPKLRVAIRSLKACPCCGSVHSQQISECFVCGWHGRFSNDRQAIRQGLIEIVERCPELFEVLFEEPKLRFSLRKFFVWLFFRLRRRTNVIA